MALVDLVLYSSNYQVFGVDKRGTLRGLVSGVSKTTHMVAEPYKRKVEEEHGSRMELQSQIEDLKLEMYEEKKACIEMQLQVNALLAMRGINLES
ncbi:hypothetical protein IFM89_006943 [Coptis chinensis]|uniref:Uncharacterized protein n=1 Tax=Coptis chinensis TaxID=261450 RepID=A0A835HB14_9MAGN|nr:hypothetical protein IFM89_006943 [Coptis chinensis]